VAPEPKVSKINALCGRFSDRKSRSATKLTGAKPKERPVGAAFGQTVEQGG